MTLFVTVVHILVCLFLIVVVLLQRGKGAEVGAMFGGGGGSTMFGARGAGNFLTRLTTGAAVVFMVTSLTLALFARQDASSTLFEDAAPAEATESPFEAAAEPAPAEDSTSPFAEVEPVAPAEPEEPQAAAPEAEASGDAGGSSLSPVEQEAEPAAP